MLEIIDSGANIHLAKQANPTMAPIIMANDLKARLSDGNTMESTHIATLQIPGISKQAGQIYMFKRIQIDPLISLVVLCDDGCKITLYKQEMSMQKNGK